MLLIDPGTLDIVDANQAAVSFYGWNHETLIRKKITDINLLSEEKILQETARVQRNERHRFNFRHRLSTGETREVEVYSGPIDVGGEQLLYSIVHDISDRKEKEYEQKKNTELLEFEVKERTAALEKLNTALDVLLAKKEADKEAIEEKIMTHYRSLILPFFRKLKDSLTRKKQHHLLDIIDSNLKELVEPFSQSISDPLTTLTPAEIQIAIMVKQGLSNKEIAQILNNSVRTISNHREHIRKKVGIKNKKINLQSFLSNSN